jgi:hypothetical protein
VDVDGKILPMIDGEIDVNFGDSLYICSECVGIMARLFGYVEPEVIEDFKERYELGQGELETREYELEQANERIETFVKAKAAIKAVKDRRHEQDHEKVEAV